MDREFRSFLKIGKALGDETRLRAMLALDGRELCLCQIIDLLQLAPSTISKHMNILADAGLVVLRKKGRWHYFRLANDGSVAVVGAVQWVREALADDPVIQADDGQVRKILNRNLKELAACYRT